MLCYRVFQFFVIELFLFVILVVGERALRVLHVARDIVPFRHRSKHPNHQVLCLHVLPRHSRLVQTRTTTLPVVSTCKMAPAPRQHDTEYFDQYGNLTWTMDARGFLTNMTYDIATGAMTQRIDDVNTALVSAPLGWTTPAGGGLHLVTDYTIDSEGRTTQVLGPSQTIDLNGVATTVCTATWNVYQDSLFQVWTGRG